MPRTSKALNNIVSIFQDEDICEIYFEEIKENAEFVYDFKSELEYVTDVREQSYVLHSLESIILTVILGIFARCNTINEIYFFMVKHKEWLEKHVGYENGLPSKSSITRVLSFMNTKELENVCISLLDKFLKKSKTYMKAEK